VQSPSKILLVVFYMYWEHINWVDCSLQ